MGIQGTRPLEFDGNPLLVGKLIDKLFQFGREGPTLLQAVWIVLLVRHGGNLVPSGRHQA
jgi:hypothetical protein